MRSPIVRVTAGSISEPSYGCASMSLTFTSASWIGRCVIGNVAVVVPYTSLPMATISTRASPTFTLS